MISTKDKMLSSWTMDDIPDLTGKVIFITGTTSGIGIHAARSFSSKNATVIMACRNANKMAQVAESCGPGIIHQLMCDISDMDSVRTCTAAFRRLGIKTIDVLLLNAGIMMPPYGLSKQGIEQTFATNHLGHWLLTGLLLDYLTNTPNSRIVCVSSVVHLLVSKINYDMVRGDKRKYSAQKAYFYSKLANLWFVQELNRKLIEAKSHTIAISAHPGICHSNLLISKDRPLLWRLFGKTFVRWTQSTEQGAQSIIMAAIDMNATRHSYYGPSGWRELKGPPSSTGTLNPIVYDEESAEELWKISEELSRFEYPI